MYSLFSTRSKEFVNCDTTRTNIAFFFIIRYNVVVTSVLVVEEAAYWERKFMLFKVYLRQSVGVSSRPKPSKSVRWYWG